MTIGLGFLFWIIVIIGVVLYLFDRVRPFSYWALLALVVILGISEFGALHLSR